MKKIFLFLTLLTLSVGQMWGDVAYVKINSLTDVTTGDYVIVGCKTSTDFGLLTYGTLNSNRIPYSKTYSSSSLPDTIKDPAGGSVWTLAVSTSNNKTYVTLYNATNSKYIASNASTHDGKYKYDANSGMSFEITYNSGSYGKYAMASGTYYLGVNKSANYWRGYASGTLTATNGLTLYKRTYKVTYNSNGGTGTMKDTSSPYKSGATVTVKTNTFTRANYTFDHWNTKADDSGSNFAEGATFNISKDTTFYAQWAEAGSACSNSIALSKGTATNGTINTISEDDLATCSETASDRRVTVTITPAACFNAPDALTYTGDGTATMQGNKTDNGDGTFSYVYQFAQNDNGSGSFGVTCTAKAPGKTVNFDAGAGTYTGGSLTETCDGSGITLPAATASGICKGWTTFAGWATAPVTDSTTTSVTVYAAGTNYKPATDNMTLYAVYSKSKGGGSGFTLSLTYSDTEYYIAPRSGSNTYFGVTTTAGDAETFYVDVDTLYIYEGNAKTYVNIDDNNTSIDFRTTQTPTAWNITENNNIWTFQSKGTGTRHLAWNYNQGSPRFAAYTGSATYLYQYTKHSLSTTYYCSDPNCCTELGSINGSVNMTQTTAALEWADLDHVSSWAVQYKEHSAANWSDWNGEQATANSKRSVTINSLSCGTAYDFKIAATAAAGYCDAEEVLEDKSTTKWDISYELSNTVYLGENDGPKEGANACGEITATFSKNALYSFPENITVTIGGDEATVDDDYLWDADGGVLYIDAAHVTGAITVAIEGVAPANPIVTPDPTALSFASVKKGAAVPAAQDIALEGHNLTAALTVVSSNTSLYTVSVKSGILTPDGNKDASPVITVTPQAGITSTAGDKNATITISGGGLASNVVVDVTFNVQETYTVNWYVNGTKIDANSKTDVTGTGVTAPTYPDDFTSFTDCSDLHFIGWATSAIAGNAGTAIKPTLVTPITAIGTDDVDYYAVFAEGTPASVDTLLYENFANELSNDNSNAYGTNNGGSKPAGFTGDLDKAYAGKNGTAKLGTSSVAGYLTSKSLDLSEAFSVTLKVKRYNDTDGGNVEITIDGDNNTKQVISNDDINSSTFESFKLDFDEATSTSTIKIGTSTKRAYIDDVLVSQVVAEDFSKYYTTCPHVSRVTLSAASVSNGSISFEQSGSAVTNVRTDGGADVDVDVVASPATGYELTGVALSGVAGASYAAGVITIPEDAEGTLVATATFGQKNYNIYVVSDPASIGATLTGSTSAAKYNVEQTITTNEPTGYLFGGWYMFDASTFDAEDIDWSADLSNEIFTGTYAGGDLELSASFLMPDKNLVAVAAFDKVYSVNEFMDTEFTKTNNKWYYVTGLVAEVPETLYSNEKMTYVISDDATKSGLYLTLFRGLGEDSVSFTAVSDLAVGDRVIIAGKWSSSYKNMNEGNYILEDCLTKKALSALAIVGTASVTTYDVGDSFDKTGLSLTATYNTGYVQANYTGTTITSNYDAPTTFTAGVTSVTVSAEEGLISTSREIGVTVSSAVLDHVEVAASAQTEFWAKETYKEPLLDAYLTDASVMNNVTGVSNTTGLDMSVAGNKSVTVTYTRKVGQTDDVTYNFTVKPVVVDEANAHSVANARAIIDVDKTDGEDLDLELAATKTYVTGVVTSVHQNTGLTGGNAVYNGTYNIVIKDNAGDDESIEIFRCSFGSGVTSVEVGDIIKAYGNLYWYQSTSKYEINTGGEVVAVVRTPNLTVANVDEMEINITADLGVDDLTIDKDGSNGAITFSCSDAAVTIVNNKLHAAAAGDATVTATIAADGIYTASETTFNVHVIAERTRYAITMDKNGGSGDDPVYASQLAGATVDLPADNTYSKANSAFDAWVVTETVSGDAVAVTDGHFTMPAAAVTIQATWNDVETCAISFQVSGAEVATADAPQTVAFSLAGVSHPTVPGFTFVGWSETEYADEVTTLPTTISSYTPEVGESTKTLYGIYSQVVGGENQHYVLDYADEELGSNTSWGDAYTTVYEHTAADGGEWTIKAYKNAGIQINTGKSAYIKVPDCAAKIIQISLTCNSSAKAALKFAETTSGDVLATGTESTSQTLDLSGETVTTGYILPSGNCQITHIDVEYSGSTTYYTSSPITRYNVTYAKGDATGVTGLCEAQRHAAGTITLCGTPTCADKTFAKWSDGVNLYNAGAEYTLSADVTFTATWTAKPKYTVTYTANGGTGSAPAVEEYLEGATVTVKENEYFSKPGFSYDGWQIVYNDGVSDHEITPEEGAFTMPAYNVTIKATWAEVLNQKWALVTDASDLEAGKKYVIAAAGYNVAMAGQNTNNRAQTTIVKKNDGALLTGTSSMQVITLEGTTGAWEFNTGAGYLYAASSGSNYLKTQAENDANGKWTIALAADTAAITATGSNTRNKMRYNNSNNLFSCYGSGQKAVALYKEIPMTEIDHAGMNQNDVPDGGDIIINEDQTWTVSSDKEVGDVYMREGAVIANSAVVEANDLYFKTKAGKSNQIFDASQLNVAGLYYDVQLCSGDLNANYWYSIAVPFDVNLNNGVFQADGTPMENRVDFEVWGYNTALRAQTQSTGWQRVSDNMMHAGKAYLIGFNDGQPNTIRLKAAEGWKDHLFSGSSMNVTSTGSGDHDNWNGLANPTLRYIDVDKAAEVFNNDSHNWDSYDPEALDFNFVVGTAFFVQSADAVAISNTNHNGQYRAPKRADDSKCAYAVRITRDEAESFDNQIIVRASEEATGEYTQGHDLLTMNGISSNTAAILWTENYGGKRLAIEEAAWSEGKATYVLKMSASADGEYAISVASAKENADLYLTYEGAIIWNLSESAYTAELKKGTNNGYGLLLVKKTPSVATGVDEVQSDNVQCTKVIIDEHVYILRGGQMFDVTGKEVR